MSKPEKKAIFAEVPPAVHYEIKNDAARRAQTMREWLLQAAHDRLSQREGAATESA